MRGRNSDNTLIKQVLGWAPATPLKVGLRKTYDWIKNEIARERAAGSTFDYLESKVMKQDPKVLDQLYEILEEKVQEKQ